MPISNKRFQLMAKARNLGNRKGEVTVYSEIGFFKWDSDDPTVTSNDFIKELDALGDVDEITVRINSPGGYVSEAIAIRTALIKHPAAKVIDIEGCCDSAATLIACLPGATVRMAKGGEYMIHRCSGAAHGNADKLLSAYNSAVLTDKNMAEIYAERTGKSADECLELMKAETWYGAEEARKEGFVDEIITGQDEGIELAACAVDEETMELMRACYAHAPERAIRTAEAAGTPPVSNESSAVAADSSTENKNEGEIFMPELKDATAEMLERENPQLVQDIAARAAADERKRMQDIDDLTPRGDKYAAMASKAKADGTSVADFLKAVVAEQRKAGKEYMEARERETEPANTVSAGDSGDHDDDLEAMADRAAKEVAELANGMTASSLEMC